MGATQMTNHSLRFAFQSYGLALAGIVLVGTFVHSQPAGAAGTSTDVRASLVALSNGRAPDADKQNLSLQVASDKDRTPAILHHWPENSAEADTANPAILHHWPEAR